MALLLALATQMECTAALPGLDPCPPEHTLVPYTLDGREIWVCITGVGPINAGIALGKVLTLRDDIHAVWTIGLAGSFDLERAPLGSVWRVEEEIWPEYGLVPDVGDANNTVGADAHGLGFAQYFTQDTPIWDRIALSVPVATGQTHRSAPTSIEYHLPVATSLTVAGVTNSPTRAAALYARYGALLENMEGFAVALACLRAGLACFGVRVVSNLVGSRAPEHRAFAAALDKLHSIVPTLCRET